MSFVHNLDEGRLRASYGTAQRIGADDNVVPIWFEFRSAVNGLSYMECTNNKEFQEISGLAGYDLKSTLELIAQPPVGVIHGDENAYLKYKCGRNTIKIKLRQMTPHEELGSHVDELERDMRKYEERAEQAERRAELLDRLTTEQSRAIRQLRDSIRRPLSESSGVFPVSYQAPAIKDSMAAHRFMLSIGFRGYPDYVAALPDMHISDIVSQFLRGKRTLLFNLYYYNREEQRRFNQAADIVVRISPLAKTPIPTNFTGWDTRKGILWFESTNTAERFDYEAVRSIDAVEFCPNMSVSRFTGFPKCDIDGTNGTGGHVMCAWLVVQTVAPSALRPRV